jgi:trimeric autotransporter adhesin
MKSKGFWVGSLLIALISISQACKNNDILSVKTPTVSAIDCASVTFSASATSGASYAATASVPYTGGNGATYEEGTAVASSGVLGLIATLSAGSLTSSTGTASFAVTGMPTSAGTATFPINLGGQSCTLSLVVAASKASLTALTSSSSPPNGVNGTAYSGTATIAYTGGNGGTYDISTATSTGVEGLTATLAAGTLANGAGNLVYTISGIPSSVGTATFNLSLGMQTVTITITIGAGTIGTANPAQDTVVIAYSSTTAAINNPYQSNGVTVAVSGADVKVTSTNTTKEIVYLLSGTATKGSFKIYSEYKYNISLKGVSLTNSAGPAINSQSGKKGTINILAGTTNTLVDGATYATSTEDQKGTFFSEGALVFMGTGTLNVTGLNKHAIVADDYISVSQANIIVKSSLKDGIHANDYFHMDSGNITINSLSDGIEAGEGYVAINGGTITVNSVDDGINASYEGTDATINPYVLIKGGKIAITTTGDKGNAIKSEGYTTIGTSDAITLSVSGKGSKGIKTGGDFTLTAGTVKITTSGAAYYDTADADIAAPAGINCDKNLAIKGGNLTITSTGSGAKGITVDGTATVNGGTTNIIASGTKFTYNTANTSEAKGFKSDGAFVMNNGQLDISATDDGLKSETSITVNDGKINVTKSYEAMESIQIIINGGVTNLAATNDGVNTTLGTQTGGTEANDGSSLTVNGGVLIVVGSDGIDSNGNIYLKGGTTIVSGSEGIDINGNFIVSGGVLISGGPNSNMTKGIGATSTQVSMFIKSSSSVPASSVFHIEDASGKELVTFKPKTAASIFHFSNPSLAKSTAYKIYYGGSYTGGNFVGASSGWGLYTGGTYSNSGATLKSSPTTSGSSTINAITF